MTHTYVLYYEDEIKDNSWFHSFQFGDKWIDQNQESLADFLECLKLECCSRYDAYVENKDRNYRLYCDGKIIFEGPLEQLVHHFDPISIET